MKLIVDEVFKQFDSKKVLKGATFTFEDGKIYGLLGEMEQVKLLYSI